MTLPPLHRPCVLALALLALLPVLPSVAQAEVRRCTAADGSLLYTDRRCEDLGATPRVTRAPVQSAGRLLRTTCARNLQDLTYEMTSAIDQRDVNRLAGLYHWVGVSGRNAYAVMARLDGIAQRPLVDIIALQASDPAEALDGDPDALGERRRYVPRAPYALRLEQTLANGRTPSRTVFGLRRHLDCWWITL
jgi:hypothetical protein